ncbi:Gfo/Idh/MocA family protein [Microlunatus soli]|uniref:Oxidoreductase family, C-terminal alpha/beta domain n=1 Tax=Microlunatus soli TaxID=630515 RepID=A0A1H2A016_9ACTN|nr:Gfo/Idh/MocA family oxidoreductase [Microlunatus soli]SDT39002.1 Oxidoreductase family, C-terminal alpha/beta domain [Microlunatus soli]
MAKPRKRYAVCGLSNRAIATFIRPILGATAGAAGAEDGVLGYGAGADDFSEVAELVAIVDVDQPRVGAFLSTLPDSAGSVPAYVPDDVQQMIIDCRPDVLIVATPDYAHADYIRAGLEHGLEVISEKPMTATAAQAEAVRQTVAETGGRVRVTHNLRYTPRHRRMKELIMDGAIGRVLQVGLSYHVDVRHGASYFVRWNRRRARSGGLQVHKSCHHLDLVNWLIDDLPDRVSAVGALAFYGPRGAHRPHDRDGAPVTGGALADHDPYYRQDGPGGVLPAPGGEQRSGSDVPYTVQYRVEEPMTIYDDAIDIEDHYSALIGYRSGAALLYSIDFSSPWEGYELTVTGTHGRLVTRYARDLDGNPMPGNDRIDLQPLFADPEQITVQTGGSGHDGADPAMRADLFGEPSAESGRLGLAATLDQAAYAVAAGEAIWRSAETGRTVMVDDLLA